MLPGRGIWFRVRNGQPVATDAYAAADERERKEMQFVAVPRFAFLNGNQRLLDRATSQAFSTVSPEEQSNSVIVDGRAMGFEDFTNPKFMAKAIASGFSANIFPLDACGSADGANGLPVAPDFGERIVALDMSCLQSILGTCHVPAEALQSWNQAISAAIERVKASSATVFVMNRRQAEHLQGMGLLPLKIFDPPPSGWFEDDEKVDDDRSPERPPERPPDRPPASTTRDNSAQRQQRPYPLSYSIVSHLQVPVTLYGFVLPIWLYGWWSIFFVPLAAAVGTGLDSVKSLDGSPIGSAFSTSTVFTLTALLHALLSLTASFGGFGSWLVAFAVSYIFIARTGRATPNFEFCAFCACVGVASMLLQAIDGIERTSVAGGFWPLALAGGLTLLCTLLALPGMPFHVGDELTEAAGYAPNGRGFGTAHHSELEQIARRSSHSANPVQ